MNQLTYTGAGCLHFTSASDTTLCRLLLTSDQIGQAKGMIMERFNIDDLRAFDMLRRLSQDSNTPLVDIAQRVIDTRD